MKKLFKLLTLVSLLAVLALLFASCDQVEQILGNTHTHEFAEWETTKNADCTTDGEKVRYCSCGEKQTSSISATGHDYDEGVCTECGAKELCKHRNVKIYEGVPATCTKPGYTEYEVCRDCGEETVKKETIPASHNYSLSGICSICGEECDHKNRTNNPGVEPTCMTYGYTESVTCDDCGKAIVEATIRPPKAHTVVNGYCSACGLKVNNDILVQLYENDNNGELSSTLKSYCAGQDTAGTDEIDTLVRNRNTNAYTTAGVNVKYNYETSYGWGGSVADIQALSKSGSASAPDIFANFAYDMTSAALRGCFANLYANTDVTSTAYGNGYNAFRFTQPDYVGVTPDNYFDSNAGEGYFYDYMQSLAFVNENGVYDKMYVLASNYCVDAVRSFLVVPVNVEMLEGISVEASTGDITGADGNPDGKFDVEDFYELVWNYDWTYDALATLSKAVYLDTNKAIAGADIKDTLGFAVGKSSGLTGAGILYSTSVKIINRVVRDGKIIYEYPSVNSDLIGIADELYDLFKNNPGVCTIDSKGVWDAGIDARDDLDGIRKRFAQNYVLFGGVIAVGSLEDDVYQQMNEPGKKGFGFVPVPLYKQDEAHTEQYNTLVHNLARVFAISATTTKFEKCTTFLNYQSVNSKDILEMYCAENLVARVEVGEAADHNVKMLNYIRNHVRDCFDKTYEDIISNYQGVTDAQASSKRWHGILYTNGYIVDNMDTRYAEERVPKQTQLETVLLEWAKLK